MPEREGALRELEVRAGNNILDNNLLACSAAHLQKVFAMLKGQSQIRFTGGFEAARLSDWIVEELRGLKVKSMFLAYDRAGQRGAVQRAVERLGRYFPRGKIFCYAMIGYENDTLDAAEGRLRWLWEIGTIPFAMLYRKASKDFRDSYAQPGRPWKDLAAKWMKPGEIKRMMGALQARKYSSACEAGKVATCG